MRRIAVLLSLAIVLAVPAQAFGTTYSWVGGAPGGNQNAWTSKKNWAPNAAYPGQATTADIAFVNTVADFCNFDVASPNSLTLASVTVTGTLNVNGGGNLMTPSLTLGTGTASTGITTVTAGSLVATNVVINNGARLAITAGTVSVSTLTVNAGGLLVATGGTLSVTNLVVAGGTATLSTATTVPNVTLSSGTLDGTAHMTVGKTFAFSGGTLSSAATTTISSGATMTVSGAGAKTITSRVIDNKGAVVVTGAGSIAGTAASILNSGTIDFQSDASITGGASIVNTGTIMKSAGTGTSSIGLTLTNVGVLRSDSGTIALTSTPANLSGGVLTGGTYAVSSGAKIQLPSGITTNAATVSIDGATSQITTPGGPALAGLAANTGTLTLKNAKVVNTRTAFSNWGELDLVSGGSLHTSSTVTLAPTSVTSMTVSGTTPGTNYGQLIADGAATLDGTLSANFSYTPVVGDSIKAMTFASSTGILAHVVSVVATTAPLTEYHIQYVALAFEAAVISVSVDTSAVPFGPLPASAMATCPIVVNAVNSGNVVEKFTITGSNAVGRTGGAWTLSPTQGADTYRMRAIANGSATDMSTSPVTFPGDPPTGIGRSLPFQLWIGVPTSSSVKGTYDATITVTAVSAY
jgi:hypothetical protein